MVKIAPKGKKVTGSSKKDKITWVSKKAWKKNLTVKAGGGNDIINFKKSKYKNTIYGEAGNDKIYGGTGNDKIYGGKGKDTINAGKGNNTIYFNKGDGTDTILNGNGIDTLVFAKETKKTLKAKISGKNIVLTGKKGKNTVILKNFMNGNHSAQYVTIGKKKVKVETLISVKNITSSSTSIKGTNLRDKITSTADHAVINALGGDDTINVHGNYFAITPGKGDDVINIVSNNQGTVRTGTITINKGDGNDTINGIVDMQENKHGLNFDVILHGDALYQNFHGIPYVEGNISGNNLILNLIGGGTLTITDYMLLNHAQQFGSLAFVTPELPSGPVSVTQFYRTEGANIEIVKNKNILINKDYTLAATVDNGLHNVNVQSKENQLGFNGGTNNVTVTGENNILRFYAGTNNTVDISGNDNSYNFENGTINIVNVDSTGSSSLLFNGNNNDVTTSGLGSGHVRLVFKSNDKSRANVVNYGSYGSIQNYGYSDITVSGNYNKEIEICSNNAKTEIRGVAESQKTEIRYREEGEAQDIVFTHYYNANSLTSGDDFITLKAFDENGNFMDTETIIHGNWTSGNFDLESLTKDILQIDYNYTEGVGYTQAELNELTQYIDMAEYHNMTDSHIYDFNFSGILDIAKDVYIQGTSANETYDNYNFKGKQVLNEIGGIDTLNFDLDADNISFFFNVKNLNGEISIGNDLIFLANTDLYEFLTSDDALDYLLVKNAFDDENGMIENITSQNGTYKLNLNNLTKNGTIDSNASIVQEVAAWLTTYGYSNVADAIHSDSFKNATDTRVNELYNIYALDSTTGRSIYNYWQTA